MRKLALSIIVMVFSALGLGATVAFWHRSTYAEVMTSDTSPVSLPILQAAPATNLAVPGASAYAVDVTTMTPLYAQNETATRPIASITKLMTLMVVLSRHSTDEVVTIGQLPNYDPVDEQLGLTKGDRYSLGDLAKAALIPSDNDAADALAIYDAGSQDAFIKEMNAKVAEWGIGDMHFASTSGLVDNNNYASAEALAKLGKLALANPTIKQLIALPSATITRPDGSLTQVATTNDLLAADGFYGIKTGYTDAAGQCFIGLTTINGHDVITVVLGSDDRFRDTLAVRNWIQGAWKWQ